MPLSDRINASVSLFGSALLQKLPATKILFTSDEPQDTAYVNET